MDVQVADVVESPGAIPEETPMPPRRLTWREIADDLEQRIRSGEYPPGQHIPSYARLAELYDVSVSTTAKAVALLAERRLVETDPGRGVLVRDPEE